MSPSRRLGSEIRPLIELSSPFSLSLIDPPCPITRRLRVLMDPVFLSSCVWTIVILYIPFPLFDSLTTPDLSYVYAFLSPFILMDNGSTFLSGFSRDSVDRVPDSSPLVLT